MRPTIVIVDDSGDYVEAARALLESEGWTVLGSASTTAEAVEICARLQPDVVLVDLGLGTESGLDAARELDRSGTTATIVLTSTRVDMADLVESSAAAGFIAKTDLTGEAILPFARPR
jgi:DNA-binding NarL/FixJ family response regulator